MSDKSCTLFFSLRTQFENLGDCIINELSLREFAKHARVSILESRAPEWLLQRMQTVSDISLSSSQSAWYFELVKSLFARRAGFLFKPGHYYQSDNWRALIRSAALLLFCKTFTACGGKIFRAGVSLGQLGSSQEWIQARIARLHTVYGVRDEFSLDYARRLGNKSPVYTPDLAFLLPTSELSGSEASRHLVTISFRSQHDTDESHFLDRICAMLQTVSRSNDLQLKVMQQVAYDAEISGELSRRLECDTEIFVQSEESVQHIFSTYRSSMLVVGNRLHSLLFGWLSGAIPIPIIDRVKNGKIIELFDKVGLGELIVYSDEVEQFEVRVRAVLKEKEQWRAKLRQIHVEQQELLQRTIESCIHSFDATRRA